jgi:RNA polymerase sigma-70 factor (ECF subfamily)
MTVIEAHGTTSSDILDAFRRGDPAAVRAFYGKYRHLVYGVAYRALGRRDLAEDVVQQTFIRAWQASERIEVDRDPAPWLATIARHVAIDIYRYESHRRTRPHTEREHGRDSVVAGPDLVALDVAWRVRDAIDRLPPKLAEIVRLQYLEGLTQAEISAQLEIPVGTVKSRSRRAYRDLLTGLASLR